jgi:hypothetical protein
MDQMTVARYLSQQIALCGKNQRMIAEECGYANPNIVTMMKRGSTKMPLDKVALIAKSLEVDPRHLLRLVMNEYHPEAWSIIAENLGQGAVITQAEFDILELMRTIGKGRIPNLGVTENRMLLESTVLAAVERDESRDCAAVVRLQAIPKNLR